MSKQLNITYQGKEYCLEYTRDSIRQMENRGFNISDIESKMVTTTMLLFSGAFLKNHRNVKQELIEEIYLKLKNKADLIHKLVEMYSEPVKALYDEPEESEGNANWTVSW